MYLQPALQPLAMGTPCLHPRPIATAGRPRLQDVFQPIHLFPYPLKLMRKARILAGLGLTPLSPWGCVAIDLAGELGGGARWVQIRQEGTLWFDEEEILEWFRDIPNRKLIWLPSLDEACRWLTVRGFPLAYWLAERHSEEATDEPTLLDRLMDAMREVLERQRRQE